MRTRCGWSRSSTTCSPMRSSTRRRTDASSGPSPREAPAVNGQARRVLIIEDQADARRALQRLLQIWGHHVEIAEDGPSGLETAMKVSPDVALVDVGLPGLDGYEVARRIRAALGENVRLVALTGYGQPEDRERAFDAGFDLHLVKPVDREELAKSVGINGSHPVKQNA